MYTVTEFLSVALVKSRGCFPSGVKAEVENTDRKGRRPSVSRVVFPLLMHFRKIASARFLGKRTLNNGPL